MLLGYLSVRYQLLKPLRRTLPFLLLMGVWYMSESSKVARPDGEAHVWQQTE